MQTVKLNIVAIYDALDIADTDSPDTITAELLFDEATAHNAAVLSAVVGQAQATAIDDSIITAHSRAVTAAEKKAFALGMMIALSALRGGQA